MGQETHSNFAAKEKILSPGSDNSPYFFISLIGKKYRSNRPITCPEPGLSRCCLQHHGELHSARGRGQRSGQTPSVRPSVHPTRCTGGAAVPTAALWSLLPGTQAETTPESQVFLYVRVQTPRMVHKIQASVPTSSAFQEVLP